MGASARDYVRASAEYIRANVCPPLGSHLTHIDKYMALLLTKDGPALVNKSSLYEKALYRRAGHTYYDMEFAEAFLREVLINHGRMRTVRARFLTVCTEAKNQLACMLPRSVRGWLDLLEDVLQNPTVAGRFEQLHEECIAHQEYLHCCMDASIRCVMRVRGQASYRAPAAIRDAAAIPDVEAKRRVLTIRGRTGACLSMGSVAGEGADDIAEWLRLNVSADALAQIETMASDQPSRYLLVTLQRVCPNLRCLYLDPVHLVIVYNQAFWRKRTPGQRILRVMQAKFTKTDYSKPVSAWGRIFDGHRHMPLSRDEEPTFPHSSFVLFFHSPCTPAI